jgi:iron complex transport system permease protein
MSVVEQVRAQAHRRWMWVLAGAGVAVVVVVALSLSIGDYPLSLGQVWTTLGGGGSKIESYVVFQVRAPRLAMALLAGAALGMAGAVLQGLLRNPLASPDLLGISGGSGVAAVFALLVLGATGPVLTLWAFAGGILVAALLLFAGRSASSGGYRLILAGIGVAFLASATTNYLMVTTQIEKAQTALLWLVGSLSSTPWWQVVTLIVIFVVSIPLLVASARWLPLHQMGSPAATSLGVPPRVVQPLAVAVAVLLTSSTAAFIGPVSFVALCAPAIARPLLRHGAVGIGTSALIGATILASADLIAQFAIPGLQLPVGVVTGALGAAFLLWLLATSKGRHL